MYTAVADQDHKIDIIEHINQDHQTEVLSIVQAQAEYRSAKGARLSDIFQEGVQIEITLADDNLHTEFVPFELKGDMEESLLYLAYSAMARQGLNFGNNKRQFFSVTDLQMLTANIRRLTVHSNTPLPEDQSGYAYAFMLKVLSKQPAVVPKAKPKGRLHKWFDLSFLWLLKQLSSQRRQKLLEGMGKGVRYYTLQRAFKASADSAFADCGYIDILLHDNSNGSVWANGIQVGDIITSRSELAEDHTHLADGQAVLIADETAYPTVLALLQSWPYALPPYVVIVSADPRDQDYFSPQDLAAAKQVVRIECPPDQQAEQVTAALADIDDIHTAWGALEKDSAKAVRSYLRNQRQLKGHNNRVKAYWVNK